MNIFKSLPSVLFGALVTFSLLIASISFAAPTQPPSSGSGVDLPLNIGPNAQTKSGALTVGGTLTANGALNVGGTLSAPTLCLSGDCKSSWPASSALQAGSAMGPNPVNPSSVNSFYNNYQQWNTTLYYSNGQQYSTYNNYGYGETFSATVNGSGTVVSTTNVSMKCFYSYNWYNDPNSYANTNSYEVYANAQSVSATTNGSQITVYGTCPIVTWWYYVAPVVTVEYLYQ